jgi:hypothetical protein
MSGEGRGVAMTPASPCDDWDHFGWQVNRILSPAHFATRDDRDEPQCDAIPGALGSTDEADAGQARLTVARHVTRFP